MAVSGNVFAILASHIRDSGTSWSIGTFGAIAEFVRDADEAAVLSVNRADLSVVTTRGGIRIEAHDGMRLSASESTTRTSWGHRVALCLPERDAVMSRRVVLTEVGPDAGALRPDDREAVLFDIGLGALQADLCIRVVDKGLIAKLRRHTGRSLFEPGNPALDVIIAESPHRIFMSRLGRAEVYQPIPPAHGTSPLGPHTHVLPKLVCNNRTHPATEHIPEGWVPCAHFYPAHPLRDAYGRPHPFDVHRHASFQDILARFGDPELLCVKRQVVKAISAGEPPSSLSLVQRRLAKTAARVALRQLKASTERCDISSDWIAMYEVRSDSIDRQCGVGRGQIRGRSVAAAD